MLVKYLTKTRSYSYADIKLQISPEVFHPGFFTSTKLLLDQIKQFQLHKKTLFEPGCGSGLISIYAAKKGAIATASDINPVAIEFLQKNAKDNNVALNMIQSDLFENIPEQQFDIIAINPPYYKKEPQNFKEHAWYCGEHGEYFKNLFARLGEFMHAYSEVIMVCCDGCDMEMIEGIAKENGLRLHCKLTKRNMIETNFIYKIEKLS